MQKAIDFYLLLKTWVHTRVAKNLKNKYGQKLADSAKNLKQMHLKLLAKEQFKKHLKQLEI